MNDKLEELKQELEELKVKSKELQDKVDELQAEQQSKQLKRWRADENKYYWYMNTYGEVDSVEELKERTDNGRYEIGNYYETREEAEKAEEKLKIYMQLYDLALKLNKGKKIDWDDTQNKYSITYNGWLRLTTVLIFQDIGQIYCLDKNFLEEAKKEIGEENLKKLFE